MRRSVLVHACVLALAVASLSFFVVYAFHADTPERAQAKAYLDAGTGALPFSERENAHMADVHAVLAGARVATALFLVLGLLVASHASGAALRYAGTLLVAFPAGAAFLPWDVLFTGFHRVFFPQGNWQFPAASAIIQAYPEQFFVTFALAWGGLCVLAGVALLAVAAHLRVQE